MKDSLSSKIQGSLAERGIHDPLFVLARGFDSAESDAGTPSTDFLVTKGLWLCFLDKFRQACTLSGTCGPSTSISCDILLLVSETFLACLAESICLTLGLSFCVLNPSDPSHRLQKLISSRSPRVVFSESDIEKLLVAACKQYDNGSEIPSIVAADVDDDSVAYFMYSSGSTGEPKSIVATRKNLSSYVTNFCFNPKGLGFVERSTFLTLSTPFFDPSIGDMAATLLCPHSVLIAVQRKSLTNGDLPNILVRTRPTHIVTTPAVWGSIPSGIAPRLLPEGRTLKTKLFLGGEKLSQKIIDAWCDTVELFNIYGVTEATVYQSIERVNPGSRAADVTCGEGVGTLLRIEEPGDDGYGEVVLQGDQVCLGYADQTSLQTSSSFGVCPSTGERFFRTGDIGKITKCGDTCFLSLRGRKDWQVKLNGQRVSLEEVDQTMRSVLHSVFRECCCCIITRESFPTILAAGATMECSDVSSLNNNQLEGVKEACSLALRQFLPAHMVPQVWFLLPPGKWLPQTPTGKLDRNSLSQLIIGSMSGTTNVYDNSDDELFSLVQQTWEEQLGIYIHAMTNYFHAGGDSLGALKLTRALCLKLCQCDQVIDEFGNLPDPFRPCVLMQNPILQDYVHKLRILLSGFSLPESSTHAMEPPTKGFKREIMVDNSPKSDVISDVVALGCAPLLELVLQHNAGNVNGRNQRKCRCATPLHAAVAMGRIECVKTLLDYGAKRMAVTEDGVTPLHLAASVSATILDLLLTTGDVALGGSCSIAHSRDERQQSLLHFASRSGNAEAVRALLWRYNVDFSVRDKWQRTAAHWAILNNHRDVLPIMVEFAEANSETQKTLSYATLVKGRARRERLAKKRTHLPYESLVELAVRTSPDDEQLHAWCRSLSAVMED